jgi:hypothetical protein
MRLPESAAIFLQYVVFYAHCISGSSASARTSLRTLVLRSRCTTFFLLYQRISHREWGCDSVTHTWEYSLSAHISQGMRAWLSHSHMRVFFISAYLTGNEGVTQSLTHESILYQRLSHRKWGRDSSHSHMRVFFISAYLTGNEGVTQSLTHDSILYQRISHIQLGCHPVAVHIYTQTIYRTTQTTTDQHK